MKTEKILIQLTEKHKFQNSEGEIRRIYNQQYRG